MKTLLLLLITSALFAQEEATQGLERALMPQKRDACIEAKRKAKENYNIIDMNVGCTCEKSDDRRWNCFVIFTHIPKKN